MAEPKTSASGPVRLEGTLPPVDPSVGNPAARRGATVSTLANWVVSRAANALNGVRSVVAAPQRASTERSVTLPALPPTASEPVPGTPFRREPTWFGPGKPQTPMAPYGDVAGRAFDYQPGINMGSKPRQWSGVSFEQLRALADNLDIARLCIETRKDQMCALTWSVLPFQHAGQAMRGKADDRCREVELFMKRPDRKHTWDGWIRMLLEDQMVVDAASIYVRRTKGGDVYALEVVDGTLIKPLLDKTGRAPEAPEPAYQQILKGMPAVDYSTDELIYAVRNPRSNHVYGLSNIEQIMMTINIAIRREVVKLKYFTENNIPEAIVSTPKDWGPEQVARFQSIWDGLQKSKTQEGAPGLRFVPGEMGFQPTRSDAMLMGQFDEWLARVCCFCFSLPPTAFVQQQNRATAETAKDSALEEGLSPMMVWFKAMMDRLIQDVFGFKDLEFVWDDIKQIEVAEERNQDRADVAAGVMSIDEARAKRGLDPLGISNFIMGGPNGVLFLDDLAQAHAQGLLRIQPPAPPQQFDELGNPIPPAPGAAPGAPPAQLAAPQQQLGAPTIDQQGNAVPGAPQGAMPVSAMQMGMPAGPAHDGAPNPQASKPTPTSVNNDPLAGIPSSILAAVGLGPQGPSGRSVDVTSADQLASDPELANAAHPQVLGTLRAVEALHQMRKL